jgi:tripartite-type tricarboxylate transporter receptor subunit TctC
MVIIPAVAARVPYDPIKDFTPVSIVAISATSIIVHPSVPAQTLREFMDYARANSGKLSYGSAGAGTLTNLTGEMFKQFLGATDIVHVPYRGAGPGISDLVSGHIPMMTPNITGQLLDLHRAGRLRILAVTSPERLKGAPEIPTAVEAGMPDLVAQLFNGLFVPAGTPQPIVDRIAQLTHTVLADAEFQAALIKAGLEPVLDSDPEKARRFVNDEHLRLTPMIKAAGLKLE